MRTRRLKSLGGLKRTRKVAGSKVINEDKEDKKAEESERIKEYKKGRGVQGDK
jgi:hypothetical protein